MQQFTGRQYLDIDIANCFGLDRLSWNDRLHWVDNNRPNLEGIEHNAKSRILYRKAVRALRKVERGQPTNHVMGLDATASGLQIMGALSGCEDTCKATNVINTGNREDVYHSVSQAMNTINGINVSRALCKKPVMTVFYGSTAKPKEVFGEGAELAAFYQALKEQLGGAYELMGILQGYWNPNATFHSWMLPDGHVARVPVTQTLEKSLEIDEAEHMRFVYRAKVITTLPRSRSLAANIVHSIDGWIVRQMVQAAHARGFWLAPIHDCFYTSPNNMNEVREIYITLLQWIARNNLVSKILTDITGHKVRYHPRNTGLSQTIGKSEYALS